jgi:poly(3-hydroxybutyrate) depolymerase
MVPEIVFHGDRDTTVHLCNGDQVVAQSQATTMANLQTTVQHGRVPGGRAYSRTLHVDGSGQAILEQWVIHGAGHAWSGGSRAAPKPIRTDPMPRARCCASSSSTPISKPRGVSSLDG